MREIVIDTETTGLDPLSGHRVVEIGAVELVAMRQPVALHPLKPKCGLGSASPSGSCMCPSLGSDLLFSPM